MGLGLVGLLADKIKGAPKQTGNTAAGQALAPAELDGGLGASAGYQSPQAHLSAAPAGVGHAALAAQQAGGHYSPGMASAVPGASPVAAPVAAMPGTAAASATDKHQALQSFFSQLGKSGQIAAQVYGGQAPAASAPVAQAQPMPQMSPHLGLSRYFLGNDANGGGVGGA